MKINDRVSTYLALLNNESRSPAAGPAAATGIRTAGDTTPADVEISPDAARLADEEIRRERLNAIRQQLAEGSYNISGKDVADKILNVIKG